MRDKTSEAGRVIVTHGRSLIALMIAQSLGARGIDIIGCDDVGMTVLSFSKYVSKNCVHAPLEEDEEQFIQDLIAIIRENKPEDNRPYLLMPAFDDAIIIAKHKDRFKDLITVACPEYEAINKVHPKDHFAKTAMELAIETPKTWLPKNESELGGILDDIEFPAFIKPPNQVGGRGISKLKDKTELKKAFSDLQKEYEGEQILIQESAEGVDYCYCGLFDHGELMTSMVYHNRQKFPNESGPGVVRETMDNQLFDPLAEQLMKPLKWHGVVEIDFMWDGNAETTPMMIEVNPRFWSGLDHSMKSDIDFPWHLYCLYVDGEVKDLDEPNIGYKTSLPGLTTVSRLEALIDNAFDFEELQKQWPTIKDHLKDRDISGATSLFSDALNDSITLDEAFDTFKKMMKEAKQAEKISYHEDDPFVGLGSLFILSSLIKYGELPPELQR